MIHNGHGLIPKALVKIAGSSFGESNQYVISPNELTITAISFGLFYFITK